MEYLVTMTTHVPDGTPDKAVDDVRALIEAARIKTSQVVNVGLVMLYWHIGRRINREILRGQRAELLELEKSGIRVAEFNASEAIPSRCRRHRRRRRRRERQTPASSS